MKIIIECNKFYRVQNGKVINNTNLSNNGFS